MRISENTLDPGQDETRCCSCWLEALGGLHFSCPRCFQMENMSTATRAVLPVHGPKTEGGRRGCPLPNTESQGRESHAEPVGWAAHQGNTTPYLPVVLPKLPQCIVPFSWSFLTSRFGCVAYNTSVSSKQSRRKGQRCSRACSCSPHFHSPVPGVAPHSSPPAHGGGCGSSSFMLNLLPNMWSGVLVNDSLYD